MLELYPTEEQKKYAISVVGDKGNVGKRGKGDGTIDQQYSGILVQTVFCDYLNYERPKKRDGWDGGYDYVFQSDGRKYKLDIKARGSRFDMQSHYVHNFIGYQKDYKCDFYIFANYNTVADKIQICGVVSKFELFNKAKFYNKGETRTRDDGSTFISKAPLFEIKQYETHEVSCVADIFECIERENKRKVYFEELVKQLDDKREYPELNRQNKVEYFTTMYNKIFWRPNINDLIWVYKEAYGHKKNDKEICEHFSIKHNQDTILELIEYKLYEAKEKERLKESLDNVL